MSEAIVLLLVVLVAGYAAWRLRPTPAVIFPPHTGLLYRDGRFLRALGPGRHTPSFLSRSERVVLVSTAEQMVPLPRATVLSRDQFSFRLALAASLRVTEPRVFAEAVGLGSATAGAVYDAGNGYALLQPLAAAVALELAAERALSELLADRADFVTALEAGLATAVPGARVERVLLTEITLPPETRRMFTDVERARREAEAALERARGEQASLRALSNAARLMRDHPGLAELRLMQVIEGRKGATTVVLGRDGVSTGAGGGLNTATPLGA